MKHERGQSLIELLLAMGVFVLAVSAITGLTLDVYLADRSGRERMVATFLAKEGIEAVRSIRDSSWDALTIGEHGLTISGGKWTFSGSQEDISNKLKEGIRKIIIVEIPAGAIDSDRKKITSQITWKLSEVRSQDVSLISYLTQWKKTKVAACQTLCETEGYLSGSCKKADKCGGLNLGEVGGCAPPPPTTICCCE